MTEQQKCLVVIRIRGFGNAPQKVKETLHVLHLTRNCHATLIDNRSSYVGMLQKVRHFVTWGEISQANLGLLLKKRGRQFGDKKLSDEYAKKVGYNSLDELAEAVYKLKVKYNCLPKVKPVFRLHPPKKGYKGSVKKSYNSGGAFGYRGEDINSFIKRML
ncbi:MAG: 50S ribosomal protein L30 [Thermoproteota archaeon]|nr:50S ribosomal protein L30 [Thermoproteota archaeon]